VWPSSMVYASAARGYKPTGVNGKTAQTFVVNGSTVDLIPASFAPETNTAFEIGSKNFLFDRSLRLNVAGFYYLYKNMQYIEYSPIPFGSGISNIPDVHMYGVEAEAAYTGADDRLNINGQFSLEKGTVEGSYRTIDSTVANAFINNPSFTNPCAFGGAFYNPACWAAIIEAAKDIGGNTPPAMPTFSGSIDASYRFDVPMGSLTPRVEVIYRGSEWARIFNEPGLDRVPSYTVTNLGLEFAPTGSRLRITGTMTNVFNKAGINSQYTDPYGTGQTSRQFIPPRQYILSVGYSF
jgi:iron complex outermembrane receptor protein